MSYTVKYKFRDQWLWKRIRNVVQDGYAAETSQFPIRFFMLESGARIEIPCEDTIFKICQSSGFVSAPKPAPQPSQPSTQPSSTPAPAEASSGLSAQDKGMGYAKLSEVFFWLGEYADNDTDKDYYFGQGVEYGKKSVGLLPDAVESNLWYAANMGSHGMVRGIMSSLFYLGPIEKHGNKAMQIDENYFHGAPLRLMGRFYHQAPTWPIGSGDTNKAIEILEKAVQVGPDFLYNQVYLADAYISKRRKDEAKELLEEVLQRPESEKFPKHHAMVVEEAKKLLAKL